MSRVNKLTRRHIEILDALIEFGSHTDIAKELGISPKTVESHICAIQRRWERNRAAA